MMKMDWKENSSNKQLDTTVFFSKILELKKDSISKLSKKEQDKIKQLEDFSFYIKTDSISRKFVMRIDYNFDNIKDLKLFGEKLKGQKFKELDLFTKKINKSKNKSNDNITEINNAFNYAFTREKFSSKITSEALEKTLKNKDTTLKKEDPMVNLIRFKVRYVFPYKIKKVNNKNARILPDFKGIEFSANLFEVNNNPQYYDVEIDFEKE